MVGSLYNVSYKLIYKILLWRMKTDCARRCRQASMYGRCDKPKHPTPLLRSDFIMLDARTIENIADPITNP
ncbi:hypothetical protein M407DRAFT_243439 [Tulasnella calospora MUT 4182]|uniref:Uncharacterized protein n=1 Tax=Tulasnella calospora MUT 4182 TaxID=1051891 RepID=A0A0C3QJ68_9AGAM|nr:hypothetical protein M407DRAFT_243439 [Tulasnella calospora MUT 4182]